MLYQFCAKGEGESVRERSREKKGRWRERGRRECGREREGVWERERAPERKR
jgi:hypothetical protein